MKKIIVLAGISGPATLALAQMLTGRRNNPKPAAPPVLLSSTGSLSLGDNEYTLKLQIPSGFTFYNASMLRKDIKELLARYGEVKDINIGQPSTDQTSVEIQATFTSLTEAAQEEWFKDKIAVAPDYQKASSDMLDILNAKIASSKGNDVVGAVVETFIEETSKAGEPCWLDQRRVISWRFAEDMKNEMQGLFTNPFTLKPSQTDHKFPRENPSRE